MAHILYSDQHGFRKNDTIITNMFKFANETTENLDKGFQMDSIYLDYSKAFDKADLDLIIKKLDNLGIRNKALTWIKSYLFGRKLAVSLKGSYSNWFAATSGVAQGSHSGPLLFLIFINDLPDRIQYSTLELFADDTHLRKIIISPIDNILLQCDINNL